MMNTKPAATEISFAADCFEIAGYRTVYAVTRMAPNYPAKFSDRAEAQAFAKKTGRVVKENQEPIVRRIKWS